jgi:TolB-like protein
MRGGTDMRCLQLGTLLGAILLSTACQSIVPTATEEVQVNYDRIGAAAYDAVDDLLEQCDVETDLGRLLVATLVDINNVEKTTMFGRQFAEMTSSRLTQNKADVIHATVRHDHMRIDERGQFLISRKVQNLAADYNAKYVVVGTYAVCDEEVFVSLKLVSTIDDSTVAAVDVELKHTDTVREMLKRDASNWYSWYSL